MTGLAIEVDELISSDETVSLNSSGEDDPLAHQPMETDERDVDFPIGVNCPEKIVLLLDVSNQMKRKSFGLGDEQNLTNMDLVKKSLAMFVKAKSMLNTKHQFCLAIIQDNLTYMFQDWTTDTKVILSAIKELAASESNEEDKGKTSLGSIMEFINEKIAWKRQQKRISFPDSVLRIIFICARSHLEMTQDTFEIWKVLHQSDCFFFDTLLIRDKGIVEIDERILRDANIRNENYNLQVSRHRGEFFNKIAMLLKHPLQRTPLL